MNDKDIRRIYKKCSQSLTEWLNVNDNDKVNKNNNIIKIVIVGSYLTDDFEEAESDIDILILTNNKVTKYTKKYYWQQFNDDHYLQKFLKNECISDNITGVDLNNIEKYQNNVEEHINENNNYKVI